MNLVTVLYTINIKNNYFETILKLFWNYFETFTVYNLINVLSYCVVIVEGIVLYTVFTHINEYN